MGVLLHKNGAALLTPLFTLLTAGQQKGTTRDALAILNAYSRIFNLMTDALCNRFQV